MNHLTQHNTTPPSTRERRRGKIVCKFNFHPGNKLPFFRFSQLCSTTPFVVDPSSSYNHPTLSLSTPSLVGTASRAAWHRYTLSLVPISTATHSSTNFAPHSIISTFLSACLLAGWLSWQWRWQNGAVRRGKASNGDMALIKQISTKLVKPNVANIHH